MGALSAFGDPPSLARMAIEAGSDMVLLCNNDAVTDAVLAAGSLPPVSEAGRARIEKMRPAEISLLDSETLEQAIYIVRKYA